MAINNCPECGAKLLEGALFCSKCGYEIKEDTQPQKHQTEMSGYCGKCGAQLIKGAKFCSKCRAPVNEVSPSPASPEQNTVSMKELTGNVSASVSPGNMSIAISGMAGEETGALPDVTILDPLRTVLRIAGGFIKSVKAAFSDKRALVTALVTAAVWIALWLWNRSGHSGKVSEILSRLTFAEGGTRGTVGQIVGGAFGKSMVIGMFMSLFGGEARSIAGGIKKIFTRGKNNIGLTAAGLGAAVMCYQIFAGYAGTYGMIVAVSGAVLGLQALGGNSGVFLKLAQSAVSKKLGGSRTADDSRVKSLLTGAVAGFALSAGLSALYIPWWIGAIITAAGIVTDILLVRKAAKA